MTTTEDLEGMKFYKPDKKTTANAALIRKAFREGFKQGIAFLNESESTNADYWRQASFNDFCKKYKIKL